MVKVTHESKIIGKRIRRIRKQKEMTQEFVAEKSGLSSVYISFIEVGKRNPTTEAIARIAKALGVSKSEIYK